ncbi:MAG: molecular chaperone DnaJ [Candidatus Peregrinibacteria bacterium Gr01-1014_25]|nr:MAG: molecular chaperone DnaJ [Candidatus Peregrinibacteria bacterium Gr01-1014_25]
MAKDPYTVLGLKRDASPEDVKRAYRSLSKEWHPDKHKGDKTAEERFKEINSAYEILSDPEKRRMYDQFGAAGGGRGMPGGFDFSGFRGAPQGLEDLFSTFFGGRAQSRRHREEGEDMEMGIELTLREAFEGGQRTVQLRRPVQCSACKGTGAEKDTRIITCDACGGTGEVTHTVQSFFGVIQQAAVCEACGGAGKRPEKPCHSCGGDGRKDDRASVTVRIPAGIATGQRLKVAGEGAAGRRGARARDLYVDIAVLDDPQYVRDGDDIRSVHELALIDALLGADVAVTTLHGDVTVRVAEGTQPGQVFRLRGKGMPVIGTSRHGDHFVDMRIVVPTKLSKAERKLMEEWREMGK